MLFLAGIEICTVEIQVVQSPASYLTLRHQPVLLLSAPLQLGLQLLQLGLCSLHPAGELVQTSVETECGTCQAS